MTFSLYAATVPSFIQILDTTAGLVDKAEAYCLENNLEAENILQARLAPDMFPFAKQVALTTVHSNGAIEALFKGVFSPDLSPPPSTFPELKQKISDARNALSGLEVAKLDDMIGQPMRFEFGEVKMDFIAENFLLSFSQPNFYFHATTAYNILRMENIPLGKRDYIGQLRLGV